jgi:CheY-like chemotaxis protein
MATATLSATSEPRIAELRLPPMERILIIEDDGALRTILRRLFSSEGYEVDVVPILFVVCRNSAKERRQQSSSVCRVQDPQDVIFAGKSRI